MREEEVKKYAFLALQEAYKAYERGEVPVGALVVKDGEILFSSYNQVIEKKDVTAHAEILAIQGASSRIGYERLYEADLFTTLEPCLMCTGAIILSRIRKVYFLAYEERFLAFTSLVSLKGWNHYPKWEKVSFFSEEASSLLRSFFQNLRKED